MKKLHQATWIRLGVLALFVALGSRPLPFMLAMGNGWGIVVALGALATFVGGFASHQLCQLEKEKPVVVGHGVPWGWLDTQIDRVYVPLLLLCAWVLFVGMGVLPSWQACILLVCSALVFAIHGQLAESDRPVQFLSLMKIQLVQGIVIAAVYLYFVVSALLSSMFYSMMHFIGNSVLSGLAGMQGYDTVSHYRLVQFLMLFATLFMVFNAITYGKKYIQVKGMHE